MAFDFVLYGFLAWYLERVMPNEVRRTSAVTVCSHCVMAQHGSQEVPWFCCKSSYWCGDEVRRAARVDDSDAGALAPIAREFGSCLLPRPDESASFASDDQRNIEPVTSDMHSRARVYIRKLRKVRCSAAQQLR